MRLFTIIVLALGLLSITSCSTEDSSSVSSADYQIDLSLATQTDWKMAEEILVLVNEHRASLGLVTLTNDKEFASAHAVNHTKYMMDNDIVNHDNFHYRTQALKSQGAKKVGENVAYGYTNAENVVTAWLNSPSHRRAIEGDYTHSGFGVIPSPNGTYYFTQLFYSN